MHRTAAVIALLIPHLARAEPENHVGAQAYAAVGGSTTVDGAAPVASAGVSAEVEIGRLVFGGLGERSLNFNGPHEQRLAVLGGVELIGAAAGTWIRSASVHLEVLAEAGLHSLDHFGHDLLSSPREEASVELAYFGLRAGLDFEPGDGVVAGAWLTGRADRESRSLDVAVNCVLCGPRGGTTHYDVGGTELALVIGVGLRR